MRHKSEEEKERIALIDKIRKEIDSFPHLKRGYSEERVEVIDLHLTLGYLYSDLPQLYDQSLQEFLIALSLTEELGDQQKIAHLNGIIASMYLARLSYTQAIPYYKKSIELLQTDTFNKEMMISKKGLGIAFQKTGQYEESIQLLSDAAEICVELGDIDNYMEIITMISRHYREQQEWDMVIEIEKKALKILLDMAADDEISNTYLDIGIAYSKIRQYNESLSSFKQAVNYAIKSENNLKIYQGIVLVAETFFQLRDIPSAKKEYLQALSMAAFLGIEDEIKKNQMVLLTLGASEEELQQAVDVGKKEKEKSQ
ncbi:MAG: tetratricopeptide repeat protein [Promethearchaeota archaeon]|nr:MAG: tetratricopeptide repeat protein [Candidatus Lokiarchaeota archaeon]